jgi:CDP-diacylglycerol--glycerol-3-phosphate 3-phosphatidyltransferase
VTLPTAIAIGRALMTIPTCALLAVGTPATDLAALSLFALAVISDIVDGRLARARGEVTALGIMCDPLADKLLIVGTLGALALRGLVPPWALAVVAGRELLAVALRLAAGQPLPAARDGKLKTALQVLAAATLILAASARSETLALLGSLLLLAAVALTVVSGLRLVRRAVQTRAYAA